MAKIVVVSLDEDGVTFIQDGEQYFYSFVEPHALVLDLAVSHPEFGDITADGAKLLNSSAEFRKAVLVDR